MLPTSTLTVLNLVAGVQSRHRWVETKHMWPELFAEAVGIDAKLRIGLALNKSPLPAHPPDAPGRGRLP